MTNMRILGFIPLAALLVAACPPSTRADVAPAPPATFNKVTIVNPDYQGTPPDRTATVDLRLELKAGVRKPNSIMIAVREHDPNGNASIIPHAQLGLMPSPEPGKKPVVNTIRYAVTLGTKYAVEVVLNYTDADGVERDARAEREFVAK